MSRQRRKLTDTLLSSAHKDIITIKVTGEHYAKLMPKLSKNEDGTVDVVPVIDLDTGEEALYLCPTIFANILDEHPAKGVGCFFEINNVGMSDKGYRRVEVYEIDDPLDVELVDDDA